jgi:hypothetical protein
MNDPFNFLGLKQGGFTESFTIPTWYLSSASYRGVGTPLRMPAISDLGDLFVVQMPQGRSLEARTNADTGTIIHVKRRGIMLVTVSWALATATEVVLYHYNGGTAVQRCRAVVRDYTTSTQNSVAIACIRVNPGDEIFATATGTTNSLYNYFNGLFIPIT